MSREVIERCDLCRREVSDVLRDRDDGSIGKGYIKAKRFRWEFGPFPQRLWHRVDLGWEIVCDFCLRDIRAAFDSEQETGT